MENINEYSKSDLGILVIKILKKHSSKENKLSVKEIVELLKKEFDFSDTTRTVGPAMRRLITLDENIRYDEKERKNESLEYSNWWYEPVFTDGELRYLIDYIKYSRCLLIDDKEEFCEKLKKMSNTNKLDKIQLDIYKEECDFEINTKYISNIEKINEAIRLEKQIKFYMQVYDIQKNFSIVLDKDGKDKEYIVIPKELVVKDGVYYLIATYESSEKYIFRLDKIKEIEILEQSKLNRPTSYKENDIDKYLEDRVYLLSGEVEEIKLKIKDRYIIDKLVTDFDKRVEFKEAGKEEIYAILTTNKRAFNSWVYKYKDMVEIISK